MDVEGKGNDSFQTKVTDLKTSLMQKVESISIIDLIKEYELSKLDFVKMDIEGAEIYCLNESSKTWLVNTATLAVEIHEHLSPGADTQIKNLLKDFYFSQHGEYSVFVNRQSHEN